MKKRKSIMIIVISMIIGFVFCGCDSKKISEPEIKMTEKVTCAITGMSNTESSTQTEESKLDILDNDKAFAEYLSEQKLCTIDKNFKILEPGTARDNPNGLAGAVKYDFDDDKLDELVTLTFERNEKNGEDIRIDLLKNTITGIEVADSKYLTEFADLDDIYNDQKENTIYFSNTSVIQIVTSEYNGKMYFSCIVGETHELNGLDSVYTACSIFSVENDELKTMSSMVYDYYPTTSMMYANVLPPIYGESYKTEELIATKEDSSYAKNNIDKTNARTIDKGKSLLYANHNSLDGDLSGSVYTKSAENKSQFKAVSEVFSNMLNEFGLDVVNNLGEGDIDKTENSIYFDLSYNEKMKTIIQTKQVLSCLDNNNFVGVELTLSSDLEEIIGNDSPYSEPFADETDLYEDILKYPHFYRDIYKPFIDDEYSDISSSSFEYFVTDIDGDNKKELFINRYETHQYDNITNGFLIVYPDMTTIYQSSSSPFRGEITLHDSGIILVDTDTAARHIIFDSLTGYKSELNGASGNLHVYDSDNSELSGDEAQKIDEELTSKRDSGIVIHPEFHNLSLEDGLSDDIIVVEDINEIIYTWQKAYHLAIEEFKKDCNGVPDGAEYKYALLYVDDDDIPEFFIRNTYEMSGLYTYHQGNAVRVSWGGSSRANAFYGYIKNKGTFVTYDSGGVYYFGYNFLQLSNGNVSLTEKILYDTDTYYINDTEATEKEFEDKLAKYKDQFAEITYCTYDELVEKLNTNS